MKTAAIAAADSLNTHRVASTGAVSIAAALIACAAIGFQHPIDAALQSPGFWDDGLRGTYDAFVKYAALPTVAALALGGGIAAYFGRPKNIPSGPVRPGGNGQ